jgi:RNA polymerase sigma-70 factor, ECF subfamily
VAWRTDAEVIDASLVDAAAFAEVYDRHAGAIVRFLVRRVGRDAGDELLGDVFRIAFERRGAYDRTRPDAAPWLYGIASNLVGKHWRGAARRDRALARLARDPAGDGGSNDGDERVVAAIDASRRLPAVAEVIGRLPAPERDTLLLYAWEDLTYEEIAIVLDVPVGTVRSRLNRTRRRLREPPSGSGKELSGRASPQENTNRRVET